MGDTRRENPKVNNPSPAQEQEAPHRPQDTQVKSDTDSDYSPDPTPPAAKRPRGGLEK